MKQILLNIKSGTVDIVDVPIPECRNNGILIQTYFSLLSVGTERMLVNFGKKNFIQKAKEKPDQVKMVLDKIHTDGLFTTFKSVLNKLDEPFPLGYSAVGRILEKGKNVHNYMVGDIVAVAGTNYANHAEYNYIPENLSVKTIVNSNKFKQMSLVALGATALQGIRQAEVMPGETVAVIGLGLLGQITTRFLKHYGNFVVGIDINEKRKEWAENHVDLFVNPLDSVNETMNFTRGFGVDKVIITASTDSDDPIHIAGKISRDRAIVVMVGSTGMNIPRKLYYEKELTFKLSRSYGPGRYDPSFEERGIDYPIGYVRWTERNNMQEFVKLIENDSLDFSDLITHEFNIESAQHAYSMITDNPKNEDYMGIVFKYPQTADNTDNKVKIQYYPKIQKKTNIVKIGLIGSGNFARNVILPNLKKTKKYELVGIYSPSSTSIAQTIKKFRFKYATNNFRDLLEDPNIDMIVISTTHDKHSFFVEEALKANKHVYVEKPLVINNDQYRNTLETIQKSNTYLFVGFNRRFSPFSEIIKNKLNTVSTPSVAQYTINAGYIPKNHWIQNPLIGGGRIIGEVCHFIDFFVYLFEADVNKYEFFNMDLKSDLFSNNENIVVNLSFSNGSIANILYTSMGSKNYSKERITLFTKGSVVELNNFLKLTLYLNGRKKIIKKLEQEKGFVQEYNYFADIIMGNKDYSTQYLNQILNTTKITLDLNEKI